MRRIWQTMLLLIFVSVTGCGTYANLYPRSWLVAGDFPERHKDEKSEPFGGVRRDVNSLPLGLLDLPFSMVGDLATLPITVTTSQTGGHHLWTPSVTRESFDRIQKRMDDDCITIKEMEAMIGPHEKSTVIHAEPVMDIVYQWSGPEGDILVRSDGKYVCVAVFRSNDGIDTVKSAWVNKIIVREPTVFERVTGWLSP